MRLRERAFVAAALAVGAGVVVAVAADGRRWAPKNPYEGHPRVVVIVALAVIGLYLGARALSTVWRIYRHRPNGIPRGVLVLAAALVAAALATMAFVYLGNPPRNGPGDSPGGFARAGDGVPAPGVKL